MTNLMCLREKDILDALLFEPLNGWQLVSPTLEEEIVLLSEPKEAQVAAIFPPRCKEQDPKPKNVIELMGAAAEPQGTWVCLPPL